MEEATVTFNLNLTFTPESDGRYTVNCKELPELITGGDTLDMALENAKEAFETILEVYSSVKRRLPESFVKNCVVIGNENDADNLLQVVVPMSSATDNLQRYAWS